MPKQLVTLNFSNKFNFSLTGKHYLGSWPIFWQLEKMTFAAQHWKKNR